MNKWQKEIKKVLEETADVYPDKVVCHSDGTVSAWRGFFYRHGKTSEKWANEVVTALANVGENVTAVKHIEEWKTWPKDSQWKVWIKQA